MKITFSLKKGYYTVACRIFFCYITNYWYRFCVDLLQLCSPKDQFWGIHVELIFFHSMCDSKKNSVCKDCLKFCWSDGRLKTVVLKWWLSLNICHYKLPKVLRKWKPPWKSRKNDCKSSKIREKDYRKDCNFPSVQYVGSDERVARQAPDKKCTLFMSPFPFFTLVVLEEYVALRSSTAVALCNTEWGNRLVL